MFGVVISTGEFSLFWSLWEVLLQINKSYYTVNIRTLSLTSSLLPDSRVSMCLPSTCWAEPFGICDLWYNLYVLRVKVGSVTCQVFDFLNWHWVYCLFSGPNDSNFIHSHSIENPSWFMFLLCQGQELYII